MVDSSGVVAVDLAQGRQLLGAETLDTGDVELLAEPAVAELAEAALGLTATVRSPAQALQASSRTGWELAQFDLATSGSGRLARRWTEAGRQLAGAPRWRALRWGLVAVIVANLVGLNAWAWHLDATVVARRAQVRQLLTQTFPKVRTVVDAPLQMERELAVLRQSSGALSSRDLESLVSVLGMALPDGVHATGLEFTAGQLSVKGVRLTPEQLALVRGKLSAQGVLASMDGERMRLRAQGDR